MQSPILITGCARSGTSMIAGIVHMSGVFGGQMRGPSLYNQKGMFENGSIVNEIVKPYYEDIGVDKMGQYPMPDVNNLSIPINWSQRVEKIMVRQGYKEGPWFYKCPKMGQHWPVWHYAYPNAKWIIVRRQTADVVNSCMRTGFMTAFRSSANQKAVGANSVEEGWTWWVQEHEKRFMEMIQAGLNCKQVWPERMVDGDYSQTKEMMEWLGLDYDLTKIMGFIEPKLWKARERQKVM